MYFYFNNNIKRVYDTSNNEVPLTKIQLSILAYLIKNRNTFISTKELMKSCWTEDKNPSIFSLRNQIKHMLILLWWRIIWDIGLSKKMRKVKVIAAAIIKDIDYWFTKTIR